MDTGAVILFAVRGLFLMFVPGIVRSETTIICTEYN